MTEPARLQLLGTPTLTLGDASWVLPFERRSQLVVLLGLAGGWVGRREAAAALWPGAPGPAAATSLRKTLFRLDQIAWGACVRSEGGALRFDGTTDVAAFEAALSRGQLQDALALWKGDPMAGFDDDANDDWTGRLRFERERLRADWRSAALAWLAGDVPRAAAVDLSARLLQADPWDEASLLAHVRWLERSGQPAAARDVHRRFVTRVRDELGVAPSSALLAAARTATAGGAPPPEPPLAIRLANSGATGDAEFVGRAAELRTIASLIEDDDGRLVTLLGPGGIGKSRLARRALQELAAGFADGTLFVALEDLASADEIGARLARELGLPEGDGPLERSLQRLSTRRMLIVLDNFETFDASAVRPDLWLQRCPGVKLLVTSRVRLGLAGEQLLPIDGLPCPEPEDADEIEAFDAARLFVRCVRRLDPSFRPAAEAPFIVDICARLGGLPLALELAASWTRVLGCEAIAADLRQGIELLQSSDPARPPRHASIEVVFEQSWRLLGAREREALARLSVFRGGFTPDAARAVAGAAPPVLAALADKSLLRKEATRLAMHPLLQRWSATRLAAMGIGGDAGTRHAEFFLRQMAQLTIGALEGRRDALRLLDTEFENCRAAWRHACAAGDVEALARCASTLTDFCDLRGRIAEGHALLGEALAVLPVAAVPGRAACHLRLSHAHLTYRLDRYAEAHAVAERMLTTARALCDVDLVLLALGTLGSAAMHLSRLDEAARHLREHLALASPDVDPHRAARTCNNLALVEKAAGRYDDAAALYAQALALHQRFDDPAAEVRSQYNLALLHLSRREMDAARERLGAVLALCDRHGYTTIRVNALGALVEHARLSGDFDAAHRHASAAMPLAQGLGMRAMECWLHLDFAHIALHGADLRAARGSLRAAAGLALELERATLQLATASAHAEWLVAGGDIASARGVIDLACAHPGISPPERDLLLARAAQWPASAAPASATCGERPDAPADLAAMLRGLAAGIGRATPALA